MKKRYLYEYIQDDIEEKVVLLSGPRQVGKTTLSKEFFSDRQVYLNYDEPSHRKIIREKSWAKDVEILIFDEIHKMPKWKTWIKGLYDTQGIKPRIIVTGSARLDTYKKGGDSLAGRCFHLRLHPFSVGELKTAQDPKEVLDTILTHSGFPEPFTKNSMRSSARWRNNHIDRILREDLLDLEKVRDIKRIEILVELLSERVGSTISMFSLARDLEASPHTVKHWIQILESLYVIFIVTPFSKNLSRSILKEPKIYFYDTGAVSNSNISARLENAIACALIKDAHFREDAHGEKVRLHYVRDKEKREVDFLVLKNKTIDTLIEVKLSETNLSKSLMYYKEKLKPLNTIQVVYRLTDPQERDGCKILPASMWLTSLA